MNFKWCLKSYVIAVYPWVFSLSLAFGWTPSKFDRSTGRFLIYGIRSISSETPHRSLFLEREKIKLNRTGNAVMKEWKYFHYKSICMSTADREWCETFPEGLPKIFPCAIDQLTEPRLNEQCHIASCIKKVWHSVSLSNKYVVFFVLVTFVILLSTALCSQVNTGENVSLSNTALRHIDRFLLCSIHLKIFIKGKICTLTECALMKKRGRLNSANP